MRLWGYLGWALSAAVALLGMSFALSRTAEISGYCAPKHRTIPDWELFEIALRRMESELPGGRTASQLASYPRYLTKFAYPWEEGPRSFDVWKRFLTDEYIVRVTVHVSPDHFPTVYLDECGRWVEPDPWFGDYIYGPLPPDMQIPPPARPRPTSRTSNSQPAALKFSATPLMQ